MTKLSDDTVVLREKMATDLGLNDVHEKEVVSYLHFSRSKRADALKTVKDAFEGVVESRLMEETYTYDELKDLLGSIEGVIKADIESELIYSSHTNVLLLRQLFEQAEKWKLKMKTNVSELENRELIEKVAKFEAVTFSDGVKAVSSSRKLEPLNDTGGAALLHMEIERLKEENRRTLERLHQAEETVRTVTLKNSELQEHLKKLESVKPVKDNSEECSEIVILREELASLKLKLEQSSISDSSGKESIEEEMMKTTQELLKVTSELESTKQELERKFSDTSQYKNMKKMLTSKTDTIKQLRDKLAKYEQGSR